eukprot:6211425-Pleurochrysis_carterae.AAC.3
MRPRPNRAVCLDQTLGLDNGLPCQSPCRTARQSRESMRRGGSCCVGNVRNLTILKFMKGLAATVLTYLYIRIVNCVSEHSDGGDQGCLPPPWPRAIPAGAGNAEATGGDEKGTGDLRPHIAA